MRVSNSFIPVEGVGAGRERALWRAGVTHWDAFDGPDAPGIGPTLAARIQRFVDEARGRLTAGDARYFASVLPGRERWRLFEDFRDRAAFLDIETTGLDRYRDVVTVVGVHRGGETTTLVRGRDLSAEALERALDDVALVVTYNGSQFDLPFLESALGSTIDRAHLDLRFPCNRLGWSGGLAAAERAIGIERDRPDLSGIDAVRLWHRYAGRGDDGALETLVAYNRGDVENLAPVAAAVADRLHASVFEAVLGGG